MWISCYRTLSIGEPFRWISLSPSESRLANPCRAKLIHQPNVNLPTVLRQQECAIVKLLCSSFSLWSCLWSCLLADYGNSKLNGRTISHPFPILGQSSIVSWVQIDSKLITRQTINRWWYDRPYDRVPINEINFAFKSYTFHYSVMITPSLCRSFPELRDAHTKFAYVRMYPVSSPIGLR